jgi:hypothetical protein
MNCASISVDAMRALGWKVPARGPTSRLLAAISLPYFAVQERSLDKAVQTYEYLTEDRTRLFPAAAFEDSAADLLRMARGRRRPRHRFEQMLAQDLEALVFLRSAPPVHSTMTTAWECTARIPSDPEHSRLSPVLPRLFPARDPAACAPG